VCGGAGRRRVRAHLLAAPGAERTLTAGGDWASSRMRSSRIAWADSRRVLASQNSLTGLLVLAVIRLMNTCGLAVKGRECADSEVSVTGSLAIG
jgi:hypothetical protein